ncbi:MAG: signal peptide peptidase SppA [Candidatus Eisenbacteria bacterium]|uniref:Signal peptide peptidase SppA n=1 Tax=Eiseniibacteriota bacterium TaxID=2212470 RepID=A0A948RYT1_UNCEI|nr:signal peptide peptidase SppA [Candidatus Eisenbacteria bacterium]MBU2692069.1 signal peptide peptidase SppA [Candidatus Eisenbacteria bacterium]
MRHGRPNTMFVLFAALAVLLPCSILSAGAGENPESLNSHFGMGGLVGAPGILRSVEAGLINPAAWPIQQRPGLFLAWDDPVESDGVRDFRTVLSLNNLAFAMKRAGFQDSAGKHIQYDYTIGMGFGNRSHSSGISYSWTHGGCPAIPPSERIAVGDIFRWRPFSIGMSSAWDLDSKEGVLQADAGLRPIQFGDARFTLFAEALLRHGDDIDELKVGYGIETHILPGLTLAARVDDENFLSFRVDLGFADFRPGYRHHIDDDNEHVSSTYTVELTDGPEISRLFAPKNKYPEIELKAPVTYRRYRLFDDRLCFLRILEQINGLADDRTVDGVILNLSGLKASPAQLWEIRGQLAGLRERDKKVIVYFDRLGLMGFMLASVADEIWMDPYGNLDISGLNLGRTYIKRLLDKVGIGFDEWRYYTYKSALESFSRTSMSEADREQLDAVLNDLYEEPVRLITSAREMSRGDWDRLVGEKAILTAKEALENGLIDKVGDFNEVRKTAKEAERRGSGDAALTTLYGVKGDPVWGPEEWGEPLRIALLYGIGVCDMDTGIRGRELSKKIRQAREDKNVKAIVLRADSPGGDPLPSDLVARELRETAKIKPVIVSQGFIAGSGGYWISMHGDSILATPVSITGSIGVISGHFWDESLGDKIGTDYDNVKRGEHSDMEDGVILPLIGAEIPDRPVTEEERNRMKDVIDDLYNDFLNQVAEGRGMTTEEVAAIAQGRIWSGADGLQIGLVDELGGLWRSLEMAKDAAGLPAWRTIAIQEGPGLGWINPKIFGSDDGIGISLPWAHGADEKAPARLFEGGIWESLSQSERDYLETLFRAKRRPVLMVPPMGFDKLTEEP